MVNLVFVGCEYTGKSTVADLVVPWTEAQFGVGSHFHDHFSVRGESPPPPRALAARARDPTTRVVICPAGQIYPR